MSERPYLKFAHRNVGLVIDEEEDTTVRYDLEREFEEEQGVELQTPNGRVFGHAYVREIDEMAVGHVVEEANRNGWNIASDSTGDLVKWLKGHYGADSIGRDTEVAVIHFKLTNLWSPNELRVNND